VIQGAQAVQAAQAVKAVISGTSRKLWSPQLHRSAVQRGMLVVHLVALRGSNQLCAPCTSTFFFLLAAPVEPAFSLSAMIYHGGDGPTGGLVGRYVPVLAAADCSDSCLHICFSFNGVPVQPAMTMSSPEHHSRTHACTEMALDRRVLITN